MINTEGREPGTRKPGYYWVKELGEWRIADWDGRIWFLDSNTTVGDYHFDEIDPRPVVRETEPTETQEQLIAGIMKITPNRTALRKFMRAMCLEFDSRKPHNP